MLIGGSVPAVWRAIAPVFGAAYSENRDGNFPTDGRVIRRITRHVGVCNGSLLGTDLSLFKFNEREPQSNGEKSKVPPLPAYVA